MLLSLIFASIRFRSPQLDAAAAAAAATDLISQRSNQPDQSQPANITEPISARSSTLEPPLPSSISGLASGRPCEMRRLSTGQSRLAGRLVDLARESKLTRPLRWPRTR